MIIHVLPR